MTTLTPLRILHLTFDHPLRPNQVHQWRGAFIEMTKRQHHYLHNHVSNKEYHHRYPMIQYRSWSGKASVTAFNDGVEALQRALADNDWVMNWNKQQKSINVEDIKLQEYYLRMLPELREYKLYNWLALNQENHKKWKACENLAERALLLENILASQILAFCSSVGWQLPETLDVKLMELYTTKTIRLHGNPMLAFNVNYKANILLPPGIAIGRGVSVGCGWQVPQKQKKERLAPSSEKTATV